MTTTVLNTKASVLVKNTDCDTTIIEIEKKKITDHDHAKYITPLKQPNLVSKTDFDNKLISFNRNTTSNKKKYLEVLIKLNIVRKKDYNFFLGRIYFTSNDRSQNTFLYQPKFDSLEQKNDKATDNVLSWK